MKAVIVAAGQSSRLYPLTLDLPKALLEIGGEPMLARSVRLLRGQGIEKIAVVVGFHHQKIETHLGKDVTYLYNANFSTTNNLASLFCAKDWLGSDPFLYLHGDIVYHPELLALMSNTGKEISCSLLVAMGASDGEAMKIRVSLGRFVESSKDIPLAEAIGEWVGIAYFSRNAATHLFETVSEMLEERRYDAYDTEAFTRMAREGTHFSLIPTADLPWMEVDFLEDLERAKEMSFE
jgi:choline kinase